MHIANKRAAAVDQQNAGGYTEPLLDAWQPKVKAAAVWGRLDSGKTGCYLLDSALRNGDDR
jgi:hypothetical protein